VTRPNMRAIVLSSLGLIAVGCPDPTPVDPCPGGICPERDAGGMDAAGTDTGPRPDVGPLPDAPIPPGVDAPPVDAAGGCAERWICGPWTTSGSGDAGTRTCTDLNACGTTLSRPTLTATLPALDFQFYECNVEPIFDRGCAQLACHGTETGRALRVYARGRHRIAGDTFIEPGCLAAGTPHPSDECEGSVECRCWTLPHTAVEWRRNYDSARGFALDASGVPLADMTTSELLTEPLIGGGLPHASIKFWRATDTDYATIRSWLEGATLGRTCNSRN
jgi:hypothetical protein